MGLGPILEKLPHVVGPLNLMQKWSLLFIGGWVFSSYGIKSTEKTIKIQRKLEMKLTSKGYNRIIDLKRLWMLYFSLKSGSSNSQTQ